MSHKSVAETAAGGQTKSRTRVRTSDPQKGVTHGSKLAQVRNHVGKEIGPIAKPDDIRFTGALPKRSGKIMRRLLKKSVQEAK